MNRYPLFFKHGGLVAGRGFVANVRFHGRCLLEAHEGEDFYCLFGVNPGALASQGASREEARLDFMETLKLVVFDMAEEAPDFEAFRAEVLRFFETTSDIVERQWHEAVAAVRNGSLDRASFAREESAETAAQVTIDQVEERRARPEVNAADRIELAA